MQRFHQIVFVVSLLALSWFTMMAVHELGHVIGALVTGGSVERVVLHPLTISRTDVSTNPHPGVVVWLGPILGCSIPVVWSTLRARRLVRWLVGLACYVAIAICIVLTVVAILYRNTVSFREAFGVTTTIMSFAAMMTATLLSVRLLGFRLHVVTRSNRGTTREVSNR